MEPKMPGLGKAIKAGLASILVLLILLAMRGFPLGPLVPRAESEISQAFHGRDVEIEGITYSISSGLTMRGIRISEEGRDDIRIERAVIDPAWSEIRTRIFDDLLIEEMRVFLRKDEDGWNLADLLEGERRRLMTGRMRVEDAFLMIETRDWSETIAGGFSLSGFESVNSRLGNLEGRFIFEGPVSGTAAVSGGGKEIAILSSASSLPIDDAGWEIAAACDWNETPSVNLDASSRRGDTIGILGVIPPGGMMLQVSASIPDLGELPFVCIPGHRISGSARISGGRIAVSGESISLEIPFTSGDMAMRGEGRAPDGLSISGVLTARGDTDGPWEVGLAAASTRITGMVGRSGERYAFTTRGSRLSAADIEAAFGPEEIEDLGGMIEISGTAFFGGGHDPSMDLTLGLDDLSFTTTSLSAAGLRGRLHAGGRPDSLRLGLDLYSGRIDLERGRFMIERGTRLDGTVGGRAPDFNIAGRVNGRMTNLPRMSDGALAAEVAVTGGGRDAEIRFHNLTYAGIGPVEGLCVITAGRPDRVSFRAVPSDINVIKAVIPEVDNILPENASIRGRAGAMMRGRWEGGELVLEGSLALDGIEYSMDSPSVHVGPITGVIGAIHHVTERSIVFDTSGSSFQHTAAHTPPNLHIGEVRREGLSAEDISSYAQYRDMTFRLDNCEFSMAGGNCGGSAVLDFRTDEMRYAARWIGSGLSLGEIYDDVGDLRGFIRGEIDGYININGTDTSLARCVGEVRLTGGEGIISSEVLDEIMSYGSSRPPEIAMAFMGDYEMEEMYVRFERNAGVHDVLLDIEMVGPELLSHLTAHAPLISLLQGLRVKTEVRTNLMGIERGED